MQSLGFDIDTRSRIRTSRALVENALEKQLSFHNCELIERNIRHLNTLTDNISYLCQTSEETVQRIRRVLPQVPASPATAERSNSPDNSQPLTNVIPDEEEVTVTLDDTVCHIFPSDSVNFADISVADILDQFNIDDTATSGRATNYFGAVPYSYGTITHPAKPYPSCPIFDSVLERMKLVDSDFSFEHYTCLVTHYPDGTAHINLHSDDETQILAESNIFTISIGADRQMLFQNQIGVIQETTVTVPHGSVYRMSSASQSHWKHALLPDRTVTTPRVSFTFRRLNPPSETPTRHMPPPITRPNSQRQPPVTSIPGSSGTHAGILLLTDSMLSRVPEHIFNRIDGRRCIKKSCMQLVNLFDYQAEFRYREVVVISCGVNDMSRYGLSGRQLANRISRRLVDLCKRHSNTTFVFNSILYTRHEWLNDEIDIFNNIMFELSVSCPNLLFFDSSEVIAAHPMARRVDNVLDPLSRGGIHMTRDARFLVSDELVVAVDSICRYNSGRPSNTLWKWPLRRNFLELRHVLSHV
jgi:hypothetical protein